MPTSKKIAQLAKRSHHFLRLHEYWIIECCVALFLFAGLKCFLPFPIPLIAGWDAFAFTSITLTWIFVFTKDPYEIRRALRLPDSTRHFFFFVVILAAMASILSTWLLLNLVQKKFAPHVSASIAFALITIAISWIFVHTRFASLYAHFYYRPTTSHAQNREPLTKENLTGGLIFPGEENYPDYWDFVYFSFVIGMTCQVADVGIANHRLRKLVLLHGLLSFLFNTSIIALVVNIISGLL